MESIPKATGKILSAVAIEYRRLFRP
jgi:hypothetical protein